VAESYGTMSVESRLEDGRRDVQLKFTCDAGI
jgi:hypothetical protein